MRNFNFRVRMTSGDEVTEHHACDLLKANPDDTELRQALRSLSDGVGKACFGGGASPFIVLARIVEEPKSVFDMDFAEAELRVMAEVSKHPDLVDALLHNRSPGRMAIYGIAEEPKTHYDLDPSSLRAAVGRIAMDHGRFREDSRRPGDIRATNRRLDLAFEGRRDLPIVGETVINLREEIDNDENSNERRTPPGTTWRITEVYPDSQGGQQFHIVAESGAWVVPEDYEICDPEQYTWEPK